jgi:hypothetical protein
VAALDAIIRASGHHAALGQVLRLRLELGYPARGPAAAEEEDMAGLLAVQPYGK